MNDEVIAAIEDFELALFSEGPAQAVNTLLSYSVELNGTSSEAYEKISQIYCSFLERSPPSEATGGWNSRFETKTFLTSFFKAHPFLIAQVQRSWQDSLGSLILNTENVSLDVYLARLEALQTFLPEAKATATAALQEGRCPSNHHTLRSLIQAALFSAANNPQVCDLPDLDRILEVSLASSVHSATNLEQLASVVQVVIEAALDTIQAAATVQAIKRLSSDFQKVYWKKAWSLLTFLQRFSSTACDIFWGAFSSTVFQLSILVSRHGRDHPSLSCAVKLLCNPESASMLLQCLLANPATASAGGIAGAAAGGAGHLKSIKSVFKSALVLLRDFPEAFIAACYDILTPAANAALGTRIEALNAIKLAIDYHIADEETHIWQQNSHEKLLFAMSRDPSVRLRRKAVELLQQTLQRKPFSENPPSQEEAAVLAAIAERCLDQDQNVRRVAFACLNSVRFKQIVPIVSTSQWRRIFELGLATGNKLTGGAAASTRQGREIFSASKRLLEKYLRQDEKDEEDEDKNEDSESKAVFRLNELLSDSSNTSTTKTITTSVLLVSTEVMAVLAEILTDRDLTYCTN